jgi:hypothetical protein
MWHKGFVYHHKSLFCNPENQVDVFFHSWTTHENEALSAGLSYKAQGTVITPPLNPEGLKEYKDIDPKWPAKNVISMFYSVFRANLAKREHELREGFRYDVVVKSRFDFALNFTPDFSTMKQGAVYVPNCKIKGHIEPNGIICNDQFAYGDSKTMDLYSNTFWQIDRAAGFGSPMGAEELLSVNLQINGLVKHNLIYIDVNHPFPPGKYNNTPHSLLREDL